jgi:TetR/AcrR family transcriptional regulator, regulator of cefoperazone and chloramphenicol sensitivity
MGSVAEQQSGNGQIVSGADRLRDAALVLFGQLGYSATTVRAIAERAGVTPGLVVHHYGTKENLRAAVDRYVLESISSAFVDLIDIEPTDDHMAIRLQGFQILFQRHPHMGRYLRRALLESSEASMVLFDQLMVVSNALFEPLRAAGLTRPTDDPDTQLLLAMLSGLMPALLPRHIERHLGISLRSDAGVRRWAKAEYEFMSHGVLVAPETEEATTRCATATKTDE